MHATEMYTFGEGNLVWIRSHPHPLSHTLIQTPVRVEKKLGPVNYRVQWLTGKMKVDNVKVVDMKPYYVCKDVTIAYVCLSLRHK